MKKEIFTIYDSKLEAYSTPMFFDTKGVAIRSFMESLKNPEFTISRHPEDFTLFQLGIWDDKTAKFEENVAPVSAGLALEFMPKNSTIKPLYPVQTDDHASEVKGA